MFELNFETRNAAFTENAGDASVESARIMRDVAEALDNGCLQGSVIDVNGNRVGYWTLTEGDD